MTKKYNITINRKLTKINDVKSWLELEKWEQNIDWIEDIKHQTTIISFTDPQKAFKFFCRWSSI